MKYLFTYSNSRLGSHIKVETDDIEKIRGLIESYSTVFGDIVVIDCETNEVIYSN